MNRWAEAVTAGLLGLSLFSMWRQLNAPPRWEFTLQERVRLGELLRRLEHAGHSVRLEHVSNVLGWPREKARWALELLTARGVLRNWED